MLGGPISRSVLVGLTTSQRTCALGWAAIGPRSDDDGGEYRSRTDDLLLAKQAL